MTDIVMFKKDRSLLWRRRARDEVLKKTSRFKQVLCSSPHLNPLLRERTFAFMKDKL
jgi:hypothetical protein